MTAEMVLNHPSEKRSESRTIINRPLEVEIDLGRPIPMYQFPLRDLSGFGFGILVRKDSSIIEHLTVGRKLKLRYWSIEKAGLTRFWDAQIKHITRIDQPQSAGHYRIGLSVLKQQSDNPQMAEEETIVSVGKLQDTHENEPIRDRTDRRSEFDRRLLSDSDHHPERRSGQDRRSGLDRRSGIDRRKEVQRKMP